MILSLDFTVKNGKTVLTGRKSGELAAVIEYDGVLTVRVWSDFRKEPLTLKANAQPGDTASLSVFRARMELRVNGELCDEEWQYGKLYLEKDCAQSGDIPVKISEKETEGTVGTNTRRAIATAQIRIPGVNIGDCIPFSDPENDGRYHLIYLYDRHHHGSKWGFGAHQWAHLTTTDFENWDEYPMAVPITEPWEGSICTGSVCKAVKDDKKTAYYAWYAVRMCDRSPARITCACSDDMVRFTKCKEFFSLPEGYEPTSARDPMVFYLDGLYHMFVTTSRLSDNTGCLAHLVNDRMAIDGWKNAGIALPWGDIASPGDERRFWQPECPDHFRMGDYFYLVFGIGGVGHYVYSKDPYSGWVYDENNTIPCGNVPKSAVLPGDGRRIFCGFICEGGYGGRLRAIEAKQKGDGRLEFTDIIN